MLDAANVVEADPIEGVGHSWKFLQGDGGNLDEVEEVDLLIDTEDVDLLIDEDGPADSWDGSQPDRN